MSTKGDYNSPLEQEESEASIQARVWRWFYSTYPEYRLKPYKKKNISLPRCLLVHNYNNPRNKVIGAKLSGMGVMRGFPDMTLYVAKGGYNGLILELKKKDEKPRPEQRDFLEALRDQGYADKWTDNYNDAIKIIKDYIEEKI